MATSMRGGGSERQVVLLAQHLPRQDFDVHLYLTHRTGELLAELPADVTLHCPGQAKTSSLGAVLGRIPGTILRRQAIEFAELVRRERIDVVYDRAFHNTLIAGHPAIQGLAVRRVSTIVSPPHAALPMVEKRFIQAKRRMLAAAYRRSAEVIAVSQAAADSAVQYYQLPADRITVVRNPIDIESVRASAGWQARPAGELQRDPLQLVCVGRMTPEKGQADLIAALARLPAEWPQRLPRLAVKLIGDGPDRAALEQQWAAVIGSDGTCGGHSLEFAGMITPALREISQADALVLPSRFEGLPNVVLEAFALRVPVIATVSGGTPELQVDPQNPTCVWANPADPASLVDALQRCADNPHEMGGQVQAAEEVIRSRHGMAQTIAKISEMLMG